MAVLPLAGIRVADFSWIINGPQIAQWFAVMGAEVIKVESQVYIDINRVNPVGMADRIVGRIVAGSTTLSTTERKPSL